MEYSIIYICNAMYLYRTTENIRIWYTSRIAVQLCKCSYVAWTVAYLAICLAVPYGNRTHGVPFIYYECSFRSFLFVLSRTVPFLHPVKHKRDTPNNCPKPIHDHMCAASTKTTAKKQKKKIVCSSRGRSSRSSRTIDSRDTNCHAISN